MTLLYPRIAQRAFNTPLLVDPAKAAAFLAGFGPRIAGGALRIEAPEVPPERAARAAALDPRMSVLTGGRVRERAGDRLYELDRGVAVIEVVDTLVHRGSWIGSSSGTTSYEGLAAQVAAAAADPQVKGIALEIDSYGGEVAGVFALAAALRAARAVKPVRAFVAESALSAGYALAAQAGHVVLPETGEAGSIGVLVMHADYSGMISEQGVTVTLIHAGARKVDANPFEPLPEAVRGRLQRDVEALRKLFAREVAAGRAGRLSATAALATEAAVLRGRAAVEAGLADEVADLRAAYAAFVEEVNRPAAARSAAAGPAATATRRQAKGKPMPSNDETDGAAALLEDLRATRVAEDEDEDDARAAQEEDDEEQAADESEDDEAAQDDEDQDKTSRRGRKTAAAALPALSSAAAAALVDVAEMAGRLGVRVDVRRAIREGRRPGSVAQAVLRRLAEQAAATEVVPDAPPAAGGAGHGMLRRAGQSGLGAGASPLLDKVKAKYGAGPGA